MLEFDNFPWDGQKLSQKEKGIGAPNFMHQRKVGHANARVTPFRSGGGPFGLSFVPCAVVSAGANLEPQICAFISDLNLFPAVAEQGAVHRSGYIAAW